MKQLVLVGGGHSHLFVLEAAAQGKLPGVEVTLVAPARNNKGNFNSYTIWETERSGIALRHLPRMTHAKAIVIDGETLVTGSCNFDSVSLRAEEEIVLIASDPELVGRFVERVAGPDTRDSVPYEGGARRIRGPIANAQLRATDRLAAWSARLR